MKKILIIEDEEAVRTSIRDLLIEKKYDVYLASGGFEGVKIAQNVIPDLIISDIMMADMDGYSVIEKLKENIKTATIPFLFLTAKADLTEFRKGMGLGADDYLFKPYKAKELLNAIEVRLNKHFDIENKFQLIWENSKEGMCLLDQRGIIVMANKAFSKIIETNGENLVNRELSKLFETPLLFWDNFKLNIDVEEEVILWNKKNKWLEFKTTELQTTGGTSYNLTLVADITQKKRNELEILNSLKEKEVLLKEIHHRVKNNLQIISSLLSLQSNYLKDENSKEIFIESQNRIKSMSLIHEKLYQTKDLSNINFTDYISELINYLVVTYDTSSQVQYSLHTDDIIFHVDIAIPLGIIFNELITNSLKHGFKNKTDGEINLSIKKNNNEFEILYSDNGCGLQENINIFESDSLGFSLITNLVEQLDGKLIWANLTPGLLFKITFFDK